MGRGFILDRKGGSTESGERMELIAPIPRLQAGGRAVVRQTKSVWHTTRNSPIARILQGGEKVPGLFGGLFRRPKKAGEERGGRAGYHKSKALRSLAQKR